MLLSLVFAQVIPPLVDSRVGSNRVRGPEAAIPVQGVNTADVYSEIGMEHHQILKPK